MGISFLTRKKGAKVSADRVLVIGDSHSRAFSYNDNFIPFFLGAGKKHCFISGSNARRVKKKSLNILKNFTKTTVITYFCEPDCRFYLGQGWYPWQSEGPLREATEIELVNSAKRYIKVVKHLIRKTDNHIVILNITPTDIKAENRNINRLNDIIEKSAAKEGIPYISINHLLYTDPVTINPDYLGDQIHLNNKLQPIVEEWLMKQDLIKTRKYSDRDWNHEETKGNFVFDKRFGCYKLT